MQIPEIVLTRWIQAIQKQQWEDWRSLAYMCGSQADLINQVEPDNVLAFALGGIAREAHDRYMAMMPRNDTEH